MKPPRKKCKTCGGRFYRETTEGREYYHACAPNIDPDTGIVTPIPQYRDENIELDERMARKGIKAEGKGVEDEP